MFDRIAPRYDLLNHVLSMGVDRLWRRTLIRKMARYNPASVLDLASGTGDLAIGEARRMPGARITAADLSPRMLDFLRAKIKDKPYEERITAVEADAEALPFADGAFDAVSVGFGVRNFQNLEKGLNEMRRVTRQEGGVVFILEFSVPQGKIFGTLYRFYFNNVLPVVGGLVSKDHKAYGYLPASVTEFPEPERFVAMMRQAGFSSVTARSLWGGIAYLYIAETIDKQI